MMTTTSVLLLAGTLLLIGAASNKLSRCFNVPILLMFLALGMAVGAEGLGWVSLSGDRHAGGINLLGTAAMCFILFSGGLNTNFRAIKPVLLPGTILATVGVTLTAVILGLCTWWFSLGFGYGHNLKWGLLLGAVISSTDAAAMFALLRGRSVGLKGRLQSLLELESGSNDPMAAFLTIFMIGVVMADFSWLDLPLLVYQMGMGLLIGFALGVSGQYLFRLKLEYEGLYFVLGIALVLIAYSGTECCGANGFLAVYVFGLTLGNQKFNYRNGIQRFSEGIAWLMQVILFTTLGMLVMPQSLIQPRIFIPGLLLSAALMFVARPLAVACCLARSNFSQPEKLLISWAGLRGAAPIVLATFPLAAQVPDAQLMFNLIFFMVITSVLLQGVTLMPLAKHLKLDRPFKPRARIPLELEITAASREQEMHEFEVTATAPFVSRPLAQMGLPPGVLVVLLRRNGKFLQPHGDTVIQAGDGLLMFGRAQLLQETARQFFPESDFHPTGSVPLFNSIRFNER